MGGGDGQEHEEDETMAIMRAYEKCLLGLTIMVRETGSIQERLCSAFKRQIMHIDPDADLTPPLATQFLEMKEFVTARDPEGDEMRLEATTRAMSDAEAQHAADMFIAFATGVSAAYHDGDDVAPAATLTMDKAPAADEGLMPLGEDAA